MTMGVIVASGLLHFKLETSKGMALYIPQRVLSQMGYDQDTVSITEASESCSTRDADAASPGRVFSWEKCIKRLCRFAFNIDGAEVEVVTIYMRDTFLRLRRKKPTGGLKEG